MKHNTDAILIHAALIGHADVVRSLPREDLGAFARDIADMCGTRYRVTLRAVIRIWRETDPDPNPADLDAFRRMLADNGYFEVRQVPGAGWCGLERMLFTVAVVHGIDWTGRRGRFCFDGVGNARAFLDGWDGCALPVIGQDGCMAIK